MAPSGGGGGGGGIQRTWSSLPDDNLADVYLRLPSARDRARFASACRSWRAVAWRHPAPLVPVLLPWTRDGNRKKARRRRAHDLESGGDLRVRLPWFARGKRFVGSYTGGWIAASCNCNQIMIVNLSSGAQVPLSAKHRIVPCKCNADAYHKIEIGNKIICIPKEIPPCIVKIVFSDYPDSSSCILAAIFRNTSLAACRIGSSSSNDNNGWITAQGGSPEKELVDIAFCRGELYGLASHGREVYKFDIGDDDAPVITTAATICIESPSVRKLGVVYRARYIFDLRGKLSMALQASSSQCEARLFMVLEIHETPCGYTWSEVTALGDHALFLSPACSKAMRLPRREEAGPRGLVERNHIYYSMQRRAKPTIASPAACSVTRIDFGGFRAYRWDNHFVHRNGNRSPHRLEKVQSLHRWGNKVVYRRWGNEVVHHLKEAQGLRQCLETMIPSRGYHCICKYGDGRHGCIWLFLPRDL